jgi:arsenate reductase
VKSLETVLFVCVHNSARSQMAEGFVNARYGERLRAHSAGLEAGALNAVVVDAMRRIDEWMISLGSLRAQGSV